MKVLLFSLILSFNLFPIHYTFGQQVITIYNQGEERLPYVNVSIKNEFIGSHSNESGEIAIQKMFMQKEVVFSKAGYMDTTILIDSNIESFTMAKATIHNESYNNTVSGNRIVRIGAISENYSHSLSASGGAQISLEYFPGDHQGYELDRVSFQTNNEIDLAKVNIRIYAATAELKPGKYLYENDIIVPVKKGKLKNRVDLSDFDLKMPKNGIFIGLEQLIIPENIFTYEQRDLMTDEISHKINYMPNFVIIKNEDTVDKLFPTYIFVGGNFTELKNNNMSLALQLKLKRPDKK